MKKNNIKFESTRNMIYKAKEKLVSEKLLTDEEVKLLSQGIGQFPDKEIVSEVTKEEENNLDIDVLVADFNEYAHDSTGKLEEMLTIISEGKIPSASDREELNIVIRDLCDKYETVKIIAEKELGNDEMPENGSSISAYYDAIKNSKASLLKGKIQEIQKILVHFISVQSLVSKYTLALEPLQKEAKSLLDRIDNGELSDVEEITESAAAPELFMKALACENLNTDEGFEILDSLLEDYSYPIYVTRGLSTKSYFVPENTVDVDKQEKVPIKREVAVLEKASESIEKNDTDSAIKDENTDTVAGTTNELELQSIEKTEEPKEESAFTLALKAKDILLDDSKFGVLSSEINLTESKKISSSVFSNDLRKGNIKALKSIIKYFDKYTLFSAELLSILLHTIPENILESSLEFLLRKGYIRKYKLISKGDFYCMSPRLIKALTYKEASKLVDVKQYHLDVESDEPDYDTASMAAARIAYLNLFTYIAQYNLNNSRNYQSTNTIMTEAFMLKIIHEGGKKVDLYVGAFWTDYKETDKFIEILESSYNDDLEIQKFIVAGQDKNTARILLQEIAATGVVNVEKAQKYVYVLNEEAYYDFVRDVELKPDQIWVSESVTNEDADNITDSTNAVNRDEEIIVEKNQETKNDSVEIVTRKSNEENVQTAEILESKRQIDIIYNMFIDRKFYCASAYAKALAIKDSSWSELYDRIAYAVNDPMRHCTYSSDGVFDLVSNKCTEFDNDLMVATGIRTFFSNQVRYDYNIKGFYNAIKDYPVLEKYTSLSNVIYQLVEFKDSQKKGMDAYADYRAKSAAQLDDEVKKIRQEAKNYYESTILAKKQEKARQRRFLETKKLLFNVNSDIGQYIKIVADDEKDLQPLVAEFLQKNFIKEGNTLSCDNIDADMLWDYIMVYWNEAGDKMMMKLRADLMSHLRSNIVSTTTKAVEIMIRWCNLVDKANNQIEDEGSLAYKKIRKTILAEISVALEELEKDTYNSGVTEEDRAGLAVISYALGDVQRCVEGTYNESERKYFYAPFLFTDDVLLDEGFCPDLNANGAEIKELQPEYRILAHASKQLESAEDRLNGILNDGGDDFGTARLIVSYIRAIGTSLDIEKYTSTIDASEEYARETADLKKEQFIGELELAQSYGQIDNSNSCEDKKERILQIVDTWYESALENSNYGFFEHVMDSYIAEIKMESKSREKSLLEQLETFKSTSIKGISIEVKDAKIAKIQAAINQQNYTVAEDLLARADQPDAEHEDIIEENFLKEFLNDYNDYYKSVAMSQKSFAMLVSSRTRNKEERGGKRLADNWLPGGSRLGKDRLVGLLNGFGFRVDLNSVQEQNPIVRFENYTVKTVRAKDGKREIYTHPIAAFGSGAAEEGFRVVCINGKYDAAGLIDLMKQIGNAKHTMILLDCALDKPERRILARKSKTELGDKLFVVVDRTVMMYMVKNYDETKANRMLMSLIVPFGYYQPYVWESSNVMPPEIFMGRKHELERIESPTGVNIVYGGRQLGKSALLKKAKADIDKDENGDRAVLVEIKGLNYEAAAKKIGHALYDEGVLTEDITTTDWNELSRAIRKRLQSDKNRIQYLLLLLDEADFFIESCAEINYQPFDALKEIQSIGVGRFKFVIAGLRNIVRAKRQALSNNSVLTHLEAMTVTPFQPAEARELMEIPLHYLGLEFPKESESLMTLILATTNYFPGLIQMYCAKLLTAMRSKDYAGYDEADTPVYEISEDHIKKVLADSEFTEQIREKFFITLKLDEDNYYYLIALIMAHLYHGNSLNEGYSATDIKEDGKNLYIGKIANLDDDKLYAFLEELKELNVLRNTDENHYLFSKFSFFQMMGTSSEVDDKLEEYMEV